MKKRPKLPLLLPFNEENKELLDIIIVSLTNHIKAQVSRGRPGPKILNYNNIYENLQTGRMIIKLVDSNPPYPELVFCP